MTVRLDARPGNNQPVDPWVAAEWLVSPDPDCRRQGLAALTGEPAGLFASPLVAYLLASRLEEPDLALRGQIVLALAGYYQRPLPESGAVRPLRAYVSSLLAGLERARVERMLETAGLPGVQPAVSILLDRVPGLSGLLTKIAADRQAPAATRSAAVALLGELGVIEALPALEGLKTRIEGQMAGQLPMAFAPPVNPDDGILLAALRETIASLNDND